MSFLTKIFSSGAGNLAESVGNTLNNLITSKDEVMQQQNEFKKAEMQYQLELQKPLALWDMQNDWRSGWCET